MSTILHLVPGATWFAGFELPFYVSRGMVESAARDIGFTQVSVAERETALPPDVKTFGEWSYWGAGIYSGPERDYELKPNVAWLYERKRSKVIVPTIQDVAPAAGQTVYDVAGGALASGNPTVIRTGAEMVLRAGYPELANDMIAYAETLPDKSVSHIPEETLTKQASDIGTTLVVGALTLGPVALIAWLVYKSMKVRGKK